MCSSLYYQRKVDQKSEEKEQKEAILGTANSALLDFSLFLRSLKIPKIGSKFPSRLVFTKDHYQNR